MNITQSHFNMCIEMYNLTRKKQKKHCQHNETFIPQSGRAGLCCCDTFKLTCLTK